MPSMRDKTIDYVEKNRDFLPAAVTVIATAIITRRLMKGRYISVKAANKLIENAFELTGGDFRNDGGTWRLPVIAHNGRIR